MLVIDIPSNALTDFVSVNFICKLTSITRFLCINGIYSILVTYILVWFLEIQTVKSTQNLNIYIGQTVKARTLKFESSFFSAENWRETLIFFRNVTWNSDRNLNKRTENSKTHVYIFFQEILKKQFSSMLASIREREKIIQIRVEVLLRVEK